MLNETIDQMSMKDSAIDTANVTSGHHRDDDHYLSGASTSVGVSSIVDNSTENMDQLQLSSHTHGTLQKKGKLVTFYRNGDQHFKGVTIPISQKWFMTLDTLIMYLNEKISTPTGIRYIFKLSDGEEIKNVASFQPGESYIVSSVKKLVHDTRYGDSYEHHWINKPPSASKIRKNDNYLFIKNYEDINQTRLSHISVRDFKGEDSLTNITSRSKNFRKPVGREIIIISNTHRKSFYVLVVERESHIKFEDFLFDISEMLELSSPPIQTLYTFSKPHKRICSFNQLFKEFLHEDKFLACGSEFYPIEMKKTKHKLSHTGIYPLSSDSKDSISTKVKVTLESKSTQTTEVYPTVNQKNPVENPIPKPPHPKTDLFSPQYLTIKGQEKVIFSSKSSNIPPKRTNNNLYTMKLNWIYGFNSAILDNCLAVINPNEFIYCVGKVAVIYDISRYKQRYFMEHTSTICCFTLHPNGRFVASGQNESNSKSTVFIWDVDECNIISIVSGSISENIYSLDFSKDNSGEYLLLLDGTFNPTHQSLKIFKWHKSEKITSTRCNREMVKAARFHPEDSSTLVTFGYQHINIWRIFWQEKGFSKILRDKKSGLFDFCIPECVTCVAFDLMGNIVTGDSNGSIHLWSRDEEEAFVNRTLPQLYHAHKDNVSCILLIGDGTLISASNNSIKAWDSFNDFKFVKERNISSEQGQIRTIIACHPERIDGKLWIGTSNSTVLEGNLQDSFTILFQSHSSSDSPLHLTASPKEHCFVSGGSDCCIIKWSMLQQRIMWTNSVDSKCSSIAYHTDGQFIAVGTITGKLIIVQNKTGAHVMSLQVDPNQKPITCLQYSPDGKFLGVGCEKSDLKIFTILDQGTFCRHMSNLHCKNSKNVLRIDWTLDSKTIRTEDDDYNTKIWTLFPVLKEKDASEMNQFEFASENCTLTFNNLGLWRTLSDDELSVVQKFTNNNSIVYGTSSGMIGSAEHLHTSNMVDIPPSFTGVGRIASIAISFDDTYVLSSFDDKNCSNTFQWNISDN